MCVGSWGVGVLGGDDRLSFWGGIVAWLRRCGIVSLETGGWICLALIYSLTTSVDI